MGNGHYLHHCGKSFNRSFRYFINGSEILLFAIGSQDPSLVNHSIQALARDVPRPQPVLPNPFKADVVYFDQLLGARSTQNWSKYTKSRKTTNTFLHALCGILLSQRVFNQFFKCNLKKFCNPELH